MANTGAHFLKKYKFLFFVPLALLILVGVFVWFLGASSSVSNSKEEVRFVIERGSGASLIGKNLEKDDLIKSWLAFKIYVQATGKSSKIQAGEYSIPANLTMFQIVDLLLKGPTEVWISIPEGLRREEIAFRAASGLGLEGTVKEKFLREFMSKSTGLEGYLFPDTYLFVRDASASAVVGSMKSVFNIRVDAKLKADIKASDLNLDQTLTLASILERETITDEERPVVAGILIKRLNAGWPLQADATVQYAVAGKNCPSVTISCDWWPRPLTKDDIATNSPYNTYKYPGLPPGPISNPGISSIKAVIYFKDSPYWYYLHDTKGVIHYAATIEEHNANIARYLK